MAISSLAALSEYFDQRAGAYAKTPWANFVKNIEREFVLNQLPLNMKGLKVLDLAAGTGTYSRLALERNADEVTAVDISKQMLEQVPKKVRVIIGNIESIRLETCYDIIFCMGGLEFLNSPGDSFQNFNRWLNPKGKLIILTPRKNWAGQLYKLYHRTHKLSIRLFQSEELKKMAEPAHLTSVFAQNIHIYAAFSVFMKE